MDSARNIYRDKIDFAALAAHDPAFKAFLDAKGQLDFRNPDAVKQLTISLLRRDFDLDVTIPDNRLCPPVPNRLNYILWLQDLIDYTSGPWYQEDNTQVEVYGLDIGTGSSCIYPLLGATLRKNWAFLATEIDEDNLHFARDNVVKNGLESRIILIQAKQDGPLIHLDKDTGYDFTMCNPPFYKSKEEMLQSAEEKQQRPFSVCTGAPVEMITAGGEVEFVTRMIRESEHLGVVVRWYTSMLGKLDSLLTLIEELQRIGNKNWAVTEFIHGEKTKRWALAWSWDDIRPTMAVARGASHIPKHLLPFPSEFEFSLQCQSIDALINLINTQIKSLKIPWEWDIKRSSGKGYALENSWSRKARRRRQQQAAEGIVDESDRSFDLNKAALGFIIQVKRPNREDVYVNVRWIKGVDSVMFESFCGMLKREIKEA